MWVWMCGCGCISVRVLTISGVQKGHKPETQTPIMSPPVVNGNVSQGTMEYEIWHAVGDGSVSIDVTSAQFHSLVDVLNSTFSTHDPIDPQSLTTQELASRIDGVLTRYRGQIRHLTFVTQNAELADALDETANFHITNANSSLGGLFTVEWDA